jgi:hypothetical protein
MRALHEHLPGARGREMVVTHDKNVYCAAIDAFAASIEAPLVPPQSPCLAARTRSLAALPGFYTHMPNAQELAQYREYYGKLAADNAAEAERERNAACACNGARSWLPTAWRTQR